MWSEVGHLTWSWIYTFIFLCYSRYVGGWSHMREYAGHCMFVCSVGMTICQYLQIWIPSDTYMIASDKHVYILDIYKWF